MWRSMKKIVSNSLNLFALEIPFYIMEFGYSPAETINPFILIVVVAIVLRFCISPWPAKFLRMILYSFAREIPYGLLINGPHHKDPILPLFRACVVTPP